MPALRDISVHKPGVNIPEIKQENVQRSRSSAGLVTVMGFDRNDVLFRSDKVGTVQWRDSKGEIVALLIRLKPDIWGFVHRGEDDWPEMLEKYGNEDRQEEKIEEK